MSNLLEHQVEIIEDHSKENFIQHVYPKRIPVVLRGIPIGPCVKKWTPEYLSSVPGSEKDVKIHVSPSHQMDFINKNFAYRTLPFSEFVRRAAREKHEEYFFTEDEKYYLRALGDDPRKDVADIRKQFPALASDISIPEYFEPEKFFSSVFRISSANIQLWTHYDVMDNFLIQVTGRKKVILFSPRDANYLYLQGDKSEVLDVDNPDSEKFPEFAKARRYCCLLEPGDTLFIPAMWFHNVKSLDFAISVNVFWKHLEEHFYDSKDTYGNKDPLPVGRAMQILDRALKTLKELPEEYQDFYARMMVSKIQTKAYKSQETVSWNSFQT